MSHIVGPDGKLPENLRSGATYHQLRGVGSRCNKMFSGMFHKDL